MYEVCAEWFGQGVCNVGSLQMMIPLRTNFTLHFLCGCMCEWHVMFVARVCGQVRGWCVL